MRVNLEGEPVNTEVSEIELWDTNTLCKGDHSNTVYIDLEEVELDIHQVNRLIKGLELAKELFKLGGE